MSARNLSTIDFTGAERIAFATSNNDGTRERWTELSVFRLGRPVSGSRVWLAQIAGLSSVAGESARYRRVCTGTLARALRFFDDTDMGRQIVLEAEEWADAHGVPVHG